MTSAVPRPRTTRTPALQRASAEATAAVVGRAGRSLLGALPSAYAHAHTRLLRVGSAAVYRVSGGPVDLICRVTAADLLPQARTEARLAEYLAGHGVPVARPADDLVGGPHLVGVPGAAVDVTFAWWRYVQHDPTRVVPARDVGDLIAQLHNVPAPHWLAPVDPLDVVRRWLGALEGTDVASTAELALLQRLLQDAEQRWARVEGASPLRGVMHGDVPGNVLATDTGPVLIDFETAGCGPLDWDLVKLRGRVRRFGASSAWGAELVDAYQRRSGRALDRHIQDELDPLAVLLGAAFTVISRPVSQAFQAESATRLATARGVGGLRWTSL